MPKLFKKITKITSNAAFDAAVRDICTSGQTGGTAGEESKLTAVRKIVDAVRRRGDAAVAEYTARFDKTRLKPSQFELTKKDIDRAVKSVDKNLLAALERAHKNIQTFHRKHLRESWTEKTKDGSILGQRITPIESAGLYVPGGKAFYPSSVLMNIVPARVAGVKDIVMVSPPSYDGTIHPLVLAAARVAGATRVFRVGGAQAVAALAYGTNHIPAVTKIAGPGNIFVTLAKRLVSSVCDIDKEAGPSEVVVIADDSADPHLAAIELLAQAEHDEEAMAILVCTSEKVLENVERAMSAEMIILSRSAIMRKSLSRQGQVFVVRNLDEAARLTNLIAPEHLSIQTKSPEKVFAKISNVGCAVIGGETSVAVGDYYAGPNHILPTGRRARFSSPLTAEDFRKVTSIISYSRSAIRKAAPDIIQLAVAEELTAHARALELRS